MRGAQLWLRVVGVIASGWWAIRVIGATLYACRAAILALAVGGALLVFTDQARDMVLASVDPGSSFGTKLGLVAMILLWATTGWYWSRVILDSDFAVYLRPGPDDPRWRQWWHDRVCEWAPRLIGAASIGCVALAFESGHAAYRDAEAFEDAAVYRNYAWAVGLMAGIVLLLVWLRRRLTAKFKQRMSDRPRLERVAAGLSLGLGWVALGVSLLLSPVFFYLFAADPIGTARLFGNSVNVVLFGLALITPALSFLVLLAAYTKLPLFAVALLLMACVPTLFGDHHDVRLCAGAKCTVFEAPGQPAEPDGTRSRFALKDVFLRWWDANTAPDMVAPLREPAVAVAGSTVSDREAIRVPPLIMVATAGGASRAGYWTSLVLGELAARERHFAERTFLISGVSGGSLGATVFRSLVEEDRRAVGGRGSPFLADGLRRSMSFLESDFLSPALGVGMYVDLPVGAVSFLTRPGWPIDRAAALEMAWEQAWRDSAEPGKPRRFDWSDGFTKTFRADDRNWPILALNGTSVVKGKRIITSNAELQVSDSGGNLSSSRTLSHPETRYETFRFLNADMPISTAVTMSARFPVISPTGGLRRPDHGEGMLVGRVTDGGLFENFGAATADEIARYLGSRISEAQTTEAGFTSRPALPFVIVISSDPSLDPILASESIVRTSRAAVRPDCDQGADVIASPGNRLKECPTPKLESSSVITDPLRALYSGRVARGESVVAALFDRTRDLFYSTYDNLHPRIEEGELRLQIGQRYQVPFFHFRQCRIANRKAPTMSWHDSPQAWDVMRIMTGLRGSRDPVGALPGAVALDATTTDATDQDQCSNASEFFRLCLYLTKATGIFDPTTGQRLRPEHDAETLARQDCEKRWPAPRQ